MRKRTILSRTVADPLCAALIFLEYHAVLLLLLVSILLLVTAMFLAILSGEHHTLDWTPASVSNFPL